MEKYAVICKNTWTILGHVYALNTKEAAKKAKNDYHENVTVLFDGSSGCYDD